MLTSRVIRPLMDKYALSQVLPKMSRMFLICNSRTVILFYLGVCDEISIIILL